MRHINREVKHLVLEDEDVIEHELYSQLEPDEIEQIQWSIEQLEKYELNNLLSNTKYVAKIKGSYENLYYLRVRYRTNIYRIFFTNTANFHVLLYGFRKKTQKIPQKEINEALKRKEILFDYIDPE